MRIRNLNPLVLSLSVSVFIHVLLLASARPRPLRPDTNRSVPVNIAPAPPESPSPKAPPLEAEAPIPEAAPVPSIAETPAPVMEEGADSTAETFSGARSGQEGYSPVSASFARPGLREDAIKRYAAIIHSHIDRRKEYPYQARRQDQEGSVRIRFTLSRQGFLTGEPVMEKSSRYRLLNASALEAVKNAAPYPPFPEEIQEEEMSFQVLVSFSL